MLGASNDVIMHTAFERKAYADLGSAIQANHPVLYKVTAFNFPMFAGFSPPKYRRVSSKQQFEPDAEDMAAIGAGVGMLANRLTQIQDRFFLDSKAHITRYLQAIRFRNDLISWCDGYALKWQLHIDSRDEVQLPIRFADKALQKLDPQFEAVLDLVVTAYEDAAKDSTREGHHNSGPTNELTLAAAAAAAYLDAKNGSDRLRLFPPGLRKMVVVARLNAIGHGNMEDLDDIAKVDWPATDGDMLNLEEIDAMHLPQRYVIE